MIWGWKIKEKEAPTWSIVYLLMNTRVCIDKGNPADASSTFLNWWGGELKAYSGSQKLGR